MSRDSQDGIDKHNAKVMEMERERKELARIVGTLCEIVRAYMPHAMPQDARTANAIIVADRINQKGF